MLQITGKMHWAGTVLFLNEDAAESAIKPQSRFDVGGAQDEQRKRKHFYIEYSKL